MFGQVLGYRCIGFDNRRFSQLQKREALVVDAHGRVVMIVDNHIERTLFREC